MFKSFNRGKGGTKTIQQVYRIEIERLLELKELGI